MPDHHEYGNQELPMIHEAIVINEFLKACGRAIGEAIPPTYGFMLMVFEYADPSKPEAASEQENLFYISSAQRDTMLKAMAEFIDRNSPAGGS